MKKLYVVSLSEQERDDLTILVNTGKVEASKRRHAQVLLRVDQGEFGPSLADAAVAEETGYSRRTVEQIRERCVREGLDAALARKQQKARQSKLDGDCEARLVAMACSTPPEGRTRWTLRLLANQLVELDILESVSHESVRSVLKKHHQTLAEKNVVYSTSS